MNIVLVLCLLIVTAFPCNSQNRRRKSNESLAQKPPMGWNSFDSYGVYLHDKAALANLEAFAKKLKRHGYKYFVIDAGWFGEFKLQPGTMFPAEKHATKLKFNEYGLLYSVFYFHLLGVLSSLLFGCFSHKQFNKWTLVNFQFWYP